MADACALLPLPPEAAVTQAEMTAVLANMAESVLAARSVAGQVSSGDPRRAEGDELAPGPGGGRVCLL